jgi:hypothetical protein
VIPLAPPALSVHAAAYVSPRQPVTPGGDVRVRGEWLPLGRVVLEWEPPSLETRCFRTSLGPTPSGPSEEEEVGSPASDGGGAIRANPLRMLIMPMMKRGQPPAPAGPLCSPANSSK